ncbi:MAG: ankyrin repeat domain-containing protein [Noviherbaspirillum sp.]
MYLVNHYHAYQPLQSGIAAQQTTQANMQLFTAAKTGAPISQIISLLNNGASPNAINADGETIMEVAVRTGNIALVQGLSGMGVHPVQITASGKNMVSLAAEHGHTNLVRTLLYLHEALAPGTEQQKKEGIKADLRAVDHLHRTALMLAAMNGHTGVVRLLLPYDPRQCSGNDHWGRTPLMLAAMNGHTEVVRLLLEHGANVFSEQFFNPGQVVSANDLFETAPAAPDALFTLSNKRPNALMFAVVRNHTEVVSLLLKHGADIDRDSGSDGDDAQSPLEVAANRGNPQMIRLLLDHGADPRRILDKEGRSALILAANSSKANREAIRLLAAVSDLNHISRNGLTALIQTVANHNIAGLKVLLESGADVHACHSDHWTALMYAVKDDSLESMALLIDHGAKANWSNTRLESAWSLVKDGANPVTSSLLDLLAASQSPDFLASLGDGARFLNHLLSESPTERQLLRQGVMRQIALFLIAERQLAGIPAAEPATEPAAWQRLRFLNQLLNSQHWGAAAPLSDYLPAIAATLIQTQTAKQWEALKKLAQSQLNCVGTFIQNPITRLLALQPATSLCTPDDVSALVQELGLDPGLPPVVATVLAQLWVGVIEAVAPFLNAGDAETEISPMLLRTLAQLARIAIPSSEIFINAAERAEPGLLDFPLIDQIRDLGESVAPDAAAPLLAAWSSLLADPVKFLSALENRGNHLRPVDVPVMAAKLCLETGVPHAVAQLVAQSWNATIADLRRPAAATPQQPQGSLQAALQHQRRDMAARLAAYLRQAIAAGLPHTESHTLQVAQEKLLEELSLALGPQQPALPSTAQTGGVKRLRDPAAQGQPAAKKPRES